MFACCMCASSASEELRCALMAAEEAAREAEASGAASTAAAHRQTQDLEQLQLELSCVKQQHEVELANMQQAMRQQVRTPTEPGLSPSCCHLMSRTSSWAC